MRYWIIPLLFVADIMVTVLLPTSKVVQVSAPLATGAALLMIHWFMGRPDAVIEDIGKVVEYEYQVSGSRK